MTECHRSLVQAVRAIRPFCKCLDCRKPAWILAQSKQSKQSKHLLKLVYQNVGAYLLSSHISMQRHVQKSPDCLDCLDCALFHAGFHSPGIFPVLGLLGLNRQKTPHPNALTERRCP